MLTLARAPRLRSIREFAEEDIRIPDGPFEGRRFSCDRQPFSRLLFEEIDSRRWRRIVITGPSQSGKTLAGFVIPTLYHLFELRETVIVGLPDMDMAGDKWREDLMPAIESSRHRDQLARTGQGSRGGNPRAIQFRNGATLRFMSGGGGDKSRAAFTARVLIVTETDGMDEQGAGSREADKITQMEARTRAFGDRAVTIMECTVTTKNGRTWREFEGGTESRIAQRCPHCRGYVTLGRDDLQGWQNARDELEARESATFVCSECSKPWTGGDRRAAAAASVLVHRGQEVDRKGRVTGDLPRTETLGFRWSAADNLLLRAGDVGVDEWRAARDPDEDNAERKLCQFVWALPHEPDLTALTDLQVPSLIRRQGRTGRGEVPEGTARLTVGLDIGKHLCHWTATAWRPEASGTVVEYGTIDVPSQQLGVDRALPIVLREFRDSVLLPGWPGADGKQVRPDIVLVDSGYLTDLIYAFTRESGAGCYPAKGFGAGQRSNQTYRRPKAKSRSIRIIGEEYHITRLEGGIELVEVNADHWKAWLHERLSANPDLPGALFLHGAEPADHIGFAKQLTAERQVVEFHERKGEIVRWEQVNRRNHWLDSTYLAAVAAHMVGIRVDGKTAAVASGRRAKPRRRRASGWLEGAMAT